MLRRKYFPALAGLTLSLALAGVVIAGSSTDHWISQPTGKNTPLFQSINHTKFDVWDCSAHQSDLGAYFDWMHHWPIVPPTGTQEVRYPCDGQTPGVWSFTWNGSTADYSVEYTHTNNSNVTTWWKASY